jgi:hypothetical protein
LVSHIDSLLRISVPEGFRVDLDSSTAVAHWRKARDLGVLSDPVEWSLTTDVDLRDISLEVVDPGNSRRGLVPVIPIAIERGWRWSAEPLFFDNGSVHVEVLLPVGAADPAVFHLTRSVCDRFVSKSDGDRVRLVGIVEPGNDVGAFELAWQWRQHGILRRATLRTSVLSTKMNLQRDFPRMVAAIREAFPARLQLDLLRQTQWGLSSVEGAPSIQSWLAVFQSLDLELMSTVERVIRKPRLKLDQHDEWRRVERIQRMPACREEEVARAVADQPHRLLRIDSPVLDADQPENRFVKHVAIGVRDELRRVSAVLKNKRAVSDIFVEWINARVVVWERLCGHPFWRSIGPFKGLRQESLTLQRDVAYAGIRRGQRLLRSALEVVLSGTTQGGIRSIDELYELWCFVQMDRALGDLGWTRGHEDWPLGRGVWDDLKGVGGRKGVSARLGYRHPEYPGEAVALIYQPEVTEKPSVETDWEGIFATPVDQHPDFVLRHWTPTGDAATWVFDAKYRVETGSDSVRTAPSDAIHQVQRYRDALLVRDGNLQLHRYDDRLFVSNLNLVREAWGGFVLFPGSVSDGWHKHPQARAIHLVNIGAIPLRCAEPVDGYDALKAFLDGKFSARRVGAGFDQATPGARGFVRR